MCLYTYIKECDKTDWSCQGVYYVCIW